MSCLKFSQIEVTSEDFHEQEQVTDIFKIDVNKAGLPDRVSWKNGENRSIL